MRIGSLCSGYGGLELGVQAVYGGETAWVSDIDKGACKILAHRFPEVPNIGDMTAVDWSAVEPVEVITAGYPCQPFSHAGRRQGANDVRHLWPHVREAIRRVRPRLAVLENVAGHRSLGFDRVLGDLAEDGMHVRWTSLRAADVGAPHGRERLFILVTPADAQHPQLERVGQLPGLRGGHDPRPDVRLSALTDLSLLPTPAVNDMGEGKTVERWDEWTADMQERHGNGNGHGKSLAIEAQRLLPTPTTTQRGEDTKARNGRPGAGPNLHNEVIPERWGQYAAAIARWEHALGRPAPAPTMTSTKGNPQLSPAFVEWMMGLPAGWVTDVPGITRNEALKALGNGVVPQQAAEALRVMASWAVAA